MQRKDFNDDDAYRRYRESMIRDAAIALMPTMLGPRFVSSLANHEGDAALSVAAKNSVSAAKAVFDECQMAFKNTEP